MIRYKDHNFTKKNSKKLMRKGIYYSSRNNKTWKASHVRVGWKIIQVGKVSSIKSLTNEKHCQSGTDNTNVKIMRGRNIILFYLVSKLIFHFCKIFKMKVMFSH